jgi:hypothetical protein
MTKTKWLQNGDVIVKAVSEYRIGSEDKGYTRHKDILSKTVMYKDWDNPEQHIKTGMKLYRQLCETYQEWPDGQVTVSITIKDDGVNI